MLDFQAIKDLSEKLHFDELPEEELKQIRKEFFGYDKRNLFPKRSYKFWTSDKRILYCFLAFTDINLKDVSKMVHLSYSSLCVASSIIYRVCNVNNRIGLIIKANNIGCYSSKRGEEIKWA